jgi:hypothetical protein
MGILAHTAFFAHDIKFKLNLQETDCYKKLMKLQFAKIVEVPSLIFQSHDLSKQSWKGPLFDK